MPDSMTAAPPFLPAPCQMVDELRSTLPHFKQIQWLEKTDSTNADLLTMARADHGPQARPWLVGAHLQEHGRGRAGRRWQNRPGANLMFSCAFDVFITPQQLATLSPLAGLAARSEEHTSELQSLMRSSYAVFCLKKKKKQTRD